MLYFVLIFESLICFLNRNKKIISFCVMTTLFLIAAFSYGTADYEIYYNRYMYYDADFILNQTEPFYTLIVRLARTYNIPYRLFFAMEYFVIFSILYYFIQKYSKNANFVLLLYMIWPYCRDVIGLRISLGSAFLYIAFTFFLRDEKKYLVYYVLFVIVGSMFHYGMFFFLIMLVIPLVPSGEKISENRLLRLFCVLFFIEIVVFRVFPSLPFTGNLMNKINFVLERSVERTNLITTPGVLRTSLMFLIYYFLHKKVVNKLKKQGDNVKLEMSKKIYYVNLFVLLVIPLYSYAPDLCRLQQCIALLSYVEYSFYFSDNRFNRKITKKELGFLGGCIGYSLLYLFIIVLKTEQFETVFRALFEKNLLNCF